MFQILNTTHLHLSARLLHKRRMFQLSFKIVFPLFSRSLIVYVTTKTIRWNLIFFCSQVYARVIYKSCTYVVSLMLAFCTSNDLLMDQSSSISVSYSMQNLCFLACMFYNDVTVHTKPDQELSTKKWLDYINDKNTEYLGNYSFYN